MNKRARTLALAAVAAALLVVSCSTSNSYDQAKIEAGLLKVEAGHFGSLTVGKASCPADEKLTEGVSFTCTIALEGVAAPFRVTLTDVKASKIHLEAVNAKAIIPASSAEAFVEKNLDAGSAGAKATCGDAKVILSNPGDVITCKLVKGSQTGEVKLKVKDIKGNVSVVA